jgi:hypothetical protein
MDFHEERKALNYPRPASGPFQYVKPPDSNGHLTVEGFKRSDSDHLLSLLTYAQPPPLFSKKDTRRTHQPWSHKDETGRFYRSQCHHYGLGPQPGKTAAKNALLAFASANDGRFIVPRTVSDVEERLVKEFGEKKLEYDLMAADIDARERREEMEEARQQRKERDAQLPGVDEKMSRNCVRNVCTCWSLTYTWVALIAEIIGYSDRS